MTMIEYLNPSGKIVVLTGPNKERIEFKKFERKVLSEWYKCYSPKYIKIIRTIDIKQVALPSNRQNQINIKSKLHNRPNKSNTMVVAQRNLKQAIEMKRQQDRSNVKKRRIVGSTNMRNDKATEYYHEIIKKLCHPISNDIGVGILSYNRLGCISRLVDTIRKYTNLKRTTIFISDESNDKSVRNYLRDISDMVVVLNDERIGVAGNTNRLMRCLSRFNYKIILNDDIEILNTGWENIYVNAMLTTGIHHFCHRETGIYGANEDDIRVSILNGIKIRTISNKPQGAIIAYDDLAFKTVGYFDEGFGLYGMEHVDWSHRVQLSGIQPEGYHDVVGSDNFFRVHKETSAVANRSSLLGNSKGLFKRVNGDKNRIYVSPTNKSKVPEVTYVIPFRGLDRNNAIRMVLLNIKAQLFPHIEIIMSEQDNEMRFSKISSFRSIKHVLAVNQFHDQPFTKAIAFNVGVKNASCDKLILHDADMIVHNQYTQYMYDLLSSYDGVHAGNNVLYLTQKSCEELYRVAFFSDAFHAERSVGYFEGGSLGCARSTYIEIGGFDERFVGYGCFCPGNKILIEKGFTNIEDIQLGDMAFTHFNRLRKIVKCFSRNYNGDVYDIWINEKLIIKGVTPEHPFFINNEKINVSKLKIGNKIDLINNETGIITGMKMYKYSGIVYNFEVEDDHSYVVNGINVANCEDTEFFKRLSSINKFSNKRTVDLIHLWHRRNNDWTTRHDMNKRIETDVYKTKMDERIHRLNKLLIAKYRF